MPDPIKVTFALADSRVFGGEMPREKVVHQAIHAFVPNEVSHARRLRITLTRPDGGVELIYPDMWLYEIADHYGHANFNLEATDLGERDTDFVNYGYDHLALATTDRDAFRRFFHDGLKMKIMRDDEHLLVLTTGVDALFVFRAEPGQPLSDGLPSRIHHIGFVVDNLEAAHAHLKKTCPDYISDFTLLERAERLSLYGTIQLGGIRFMIQLSEIKPEFRGLKTDDARAVAEQFYDYASRDYGIRLA